MTNENDIQDILTQAGKIMAARRTAMLAGETPPMDKGHRERLQDATMILIRKFQTGSTSDEVAQSLVEAGWGAESATGFVIMLRRLVQRMYRQRMYMFGFFTLTGAMLASVLIPLAFQGQMEWWYAVIVSLACCFFVFSAVMQWRMSKRFE